VSAVLEAALAAHDAGLCVIRAAHDGTKRPVGRWKERQATRPTREQVAHEFADWTGLFIVCGEVSGQLEMLELEGRAVAAGIADEFDRRANDAGLGPLVERIMLGYCEQTPGGGLHLAYRSEAVEGNLKLARDKHGEVLIETRGEGGGFIAAPSNGTTHPTGGAWKLTDGGFATITTITPEERSRLLELCRSFDQMDERPARPGATPFKLLSDDTRPGDEFDAAHTCHDVLLAAGFAEHSRSGGDVNYTRPGKPTKDGSSATVYADDNSCTLFSSSIGAPVEYLDGHHKLSPFRLHVGLNFDGDYSEAARAWRQQHPRIQVSERHVPPGVDPETGEILTAPVLPASFWDERTVLTQIRQAAHSRNRSADLVLHVVLARIAACIPHTIELPPIVGSAGSLNYFAAGIGPSGSGKSTAVATGRELVPAPVGLDIADDRPIGSGEGLAEAYMGLVEQETEDGRKTRVRAQIRYNAFVYVDEGEALVDLMDRKGGTVLESLRRGWSGGTLGQANASTERQRVIPAGQYRLGLVIGFQAEKAARLLDDAAGGTPQRFQFASAVDPHIPDEAPAWPGPLAWQPPSGPLLEHHRLVVNGHVRHHLTVEDGIAAEIRAADLARARGERTDQPLDAHAVLHRLKVAGLLAILDGRLDIAADDWRLAAHIWRTSVQVRAGVVAHLERQRAADEAMRVERHANRELAAEAARRSAPAAVERIAVRLAKFVHDRPCPEDGLALRDLQQRLAAKEKVMLRAAIEEAITTGWINETDGRYRPGDSRPA
jgi:hypothetical protein